MTDYGIVYPLVHYLPIGASLSYERILSHTEKKYDVLFYGDFKSSSRRLKMLEALQQRFNVQFVSEVYGPDMMKAIRQAKVVINLHYYENALLETPRIQESLSLGVPVVSESAQDQYDYPELADVVRFFEQGSISAMIQAVENALQNQVPPESITRSIKRSAQRFAFMFDRFLVAMGFLSADYAKEMELPLEFPPSASDAQIVLSLPETVARRRAFQSQHLGNYIVFDGIRRLPGWVGCGLSHSSLARYALKRGIHRLTIIEDDAILPSNFEGNMSIVNEYLDMHEGQWDIFVGVMASLHPEAKILSVETFKGIRFVTLDKMVSMVCNIYHESALRLIASWDPTDLDVQHNTIDRYLERQSGLRVIVSLPFLY
ncbi:glycosyltransferase family 25 protein [Candidatus Acetothermia bacterium]|nr:glycosyltransferase family 25 protein [Candidatus Acetothermia bacterium]